MPYALNCYHHHQHLLPLLLLPPSPPPLLNLHVFCLTIEPQPLPKPVKRCDLVLPFKLSRIFLFL